MTIETQHDTVDVRRRIEELFGAERRPRRRMRRLVAGATVVALIGVGSGVAAARAGSDPAKRYRTATANVGDVAARWSGVASIEPVSGAAVAFPTSGTVATVAVAVGGTVAVGDTLATLDSVTLLAAVHESEAALAQAELTLSRALESSSTTTTTTTTKPATTAAQGSAGNTGNGSGTGADDDATRPSTGTAAGTTPAASATSTPSAEDLVADQRAVDLAAAEVAVAMQSLAQANIVAPINGTVVSVGIAVGDTVTAGSSTQVITIEGSGGFEATTVVPLTDIAKVRVGDAAEVTPDGSRRSLHGEVVGVAATPNPSSGSSAGSGFRVTIGFAEPDADILRNGATASLTITTGAATRALSVPTSAVTTRGERHTVTVLRSDGTTDDVTVGVGVVGTSRTQITRGVSAGDRVVLADLDAALPSAATQTNTTSGAGSGRGSNNGGPGGGFSTPPGFGGRGPGR
ncbi:MAG: HlyD family efflux transporter periplasmic adaptor subunit [Microthrixaceae bacterium]